MNGITAYRTENKFETRYTLLVENKNSGVCLALYDTPQECNIKAIIFSLKVEERYRKQGMATSLLRKAEQIAKSEGHTAVYLRWESSQSQSWVLDWYVRKGYEIMEGSEDHSLLRKNL